MLVQFLSIALSKNRKMCELMSMQLILVQSLVQLTFYRVENDFILFER